MFLKIKGVLSDCQNSPGWFFILSLFLFESHLALGQCNDWENLQTYADVFVWDTDRDRFGNLYAVGSFFNENFIVGTTPITYHGGHTIFILKYDKNFSLVWAKSIGNGTTCIAQQVEVDRDDNVIISGVYYHSPLMFDCIQLDNAGRADVFVVKYSPDGGVQWARHSTGTNDEDGTSLVITDENDVIVTGWFVAGSMSFEGVPVQSFGGYDSFIARLNSSGALKWTTSIGGAGGNYPDYINDADIDSNGNLVITGFFESEELYIGDFSIPKKTISENFFVAKIDSKGKALWAKGTDNVVDVGGYDVLVDTNDNIFVLGSFYEGDLEVGNFLLSSLGDADVLLIKYSTDGEALAAKNFGGQQVERGQRLALDKDGSIWAAGNFYSNVFTADNFTVTKPEFQSDIFVVKFDADLDVICMTSISGSAEVNIANLNVDPSNNIWFTIGNLFSDGEIQFDGKYTVGSPISSMIISLGNDLNFDSGQSGFDFDVNLGDDALLCPGTTRKLDAGFWCAANLLWQDGSDDRFFTVVQPGVYWVEVEINGLVARDTINVSYYPNLEVRLGEDKIICNNESIVFNVSQNTPSQYDWNDGGSAPTKTVSGPGIYWVHVENLCGSDADTIIITKPGQLLLELGEDKIMCSGETINAEIPAAIKYLWNDGSTEPRLSVKTSGKYSVSVFNGCEEKSDSLNIIIIDVDDLAIPNVITPNGDIWNDSFILPEVLQGSQVSIYNRWGERVYYSSDYRNTWRGNDQSRGVYFYTLQGNCVVKPIKGSIHLLKNE